ncbi:MAG: hypothetical protein ACI8TF_000416 [Paracoccaceae bacterium]|jgi:hypothetical protein
MASTDPAIAVLPYGSKIGRESAERKLDALGWPLGCPDRLIGGTVRDLTDQDHLIIYPKNKAHFVRHTWTPAQVSMMVVEPTAVHQRHLRMLRFSHRRFFRVFSFNTDYLAKYPNGLYLPFGTSWVPDWQDLVAQKSENISLIASDKRDFPGHLLRHQIVDWSRQNNVDVAVLGRGYQPFERKSDGLAPFRYSVVIENVREKNYFSEKLIDAVLCGTIPIYWGCPNIGDFLDAEAMIICKTAEQIQEAILSADEADYLTRLPKLQAIQPAAAKYSNLERRAAETLLASL